MMHFPKESRPDRAVGARYAPLLALFSAFILLVSSGLAQSVIQGLVTDTEGLPLPGASVLIENTTRGTSTGMDGRFVLEVTPTDRAFVVSFVGYAAQTVQIDGRDSYTVALSGVIGLESVVVTALGVKRDEKSLGYAIQRLEGSSVSEVPSTNVVNGLNGKLAGVNIQGSAAGPTASANITIRGENSLSGDNQALFVVNGIPITNGLFSSGDGLNGSTTIDFGNAAQIINPDDIAEISVLKGPAAAALYGTRAANGVILVTTKTGENATGWGVTLNSSTTFSGILKLPDYQAEYGVGGYGRYSYNGGSTYTGDYYDAFGENWGPRTNGANIVQWNSNGEAVPFTAAPDNVRNFFQTGITTRNHVAMANSTEDSDFRVGYTHLGSRGIVPNTDLTRHTLSMSAGQDFTERLHLRTNFNYVRSASDNVPNAGYDESSSIMYNWIWFPRNTPIADLEDYWKPGQENVQQANVEELWTNNPWFVVNENTNAFEADRVFGNTALEFDLTDRVNIRYRFGMDVNNDQRNFRRAMSTKSVLLGSYREDNIGFQETNSELLVSYDGVDYEKDFNVSVRAGGNIMRQSSTTLRANAPQLLIPGIYNLGNARSGVITDQFTYQKGINSVFGLANFSYKNYLFLDLTGRNDWSSTLPAENNSYFYPSASLSAIVSEVMDLEPNSALSFAKVRAAYAEVGGDTNPYRIRNIYAYDNAWGEFPVAGESAQLNNAGLLPERTSSLEFGLDMRFWKGRFGIDLAWYSLTSRDQIVTLPLASTSGYTSRVINSGEIQNKGLELVLNGTIVERENVVWNSTLNLTRNRSEVLSLPEEITTYQMVADVYPNDGGQDLSLEAQVGMPLGQLVGLGFQRDEAGNIIHENGLPLMTTEKVSAGTYQPDALIGWDNNFTMGRFQVGFLLSAQIGGKIYSRTHALSATGGAITNADDPLLDLSTLDGRETYDVTYAADGTPVYTAVDEANWGVVGPGVMYDADGNLVENTVAVATRDYFYAYYGNGFSRDNIEAATYDASYLKLRELRLGYALPQAFADRLGAASATVSIIGRNLLLFSKVPSIDPETYSIRGGAFVPGFESTSLPSMRTLGFSLNVNF